MKALFRSAAVAVLGLMLWSCENVTVHGNLEIVGDVMLKNVWGNMKQLRGGKFTLDGEYNPDGKDGKMTLKVAEGTFEFPFQDKHITVFTGTRVAMSVPPSDQQPASLTFEYNATETGRRERTRTTTCTYNCGYDPRIPHRRICTGQQVMRDTIVDYMVKTKGSISGVHSRGGASFDIGPITETRVTSVSLTTCH